MRHVSDDDALIFDGLDGFDLKGEAFVNGVLPDAGIAGEEAFARDADAEAHDAVREEVGSVAATVGEFANVFAARFEDVVGVCPEEVFARGHGEAEVASGGEVVDVGPVFMAWGVKIFAGDGVEFFAGDVEGGVGRLVADGADDDDFVDIRTEGGKAAVDVFETVAGDDAEGDFW